MDKVNGVKKAKTATALMFLLCGISVSAWAPMVPLAKARVNVNEAELGLLLLCMGGGAIITMPFVGRLIHKGGSRRVIISSSVIAALILPVLTVADSAISLGLSLFVFGAALGSLDVSMNAQAVVVQENFSRPVMSSFHGMFSVGGLFGAIFFGLLLMLGLTPLYSAMVISAALLLVVVSQLKYFLDHPPKTEETSPGFRFPKGAVIMLGIFCFIVFLVEGAMLEWSALFLEEHRRFSISVTGAGYSVFSVAMAFMRFTGDRLVHATGPEKIVSIGATTAAAGLILAVMLPWQATTLLGFLLIGIGAANIVPVLFSAAGKADPSSPELALASVTTMGYAGQLAGPPLIGFAAHITTLPVALGLLAAPLLLVALSYGRGRRKSSAGV